VRFLGTREASWRAVDCPTGDLPIQYVFATTSVSKSFFAIHVWDLRVSLTAVEVRVQCEGGGLRWLVLKCTGAYGFHYQGQEACGDAVHGWPYVTLRLTSTYNEVLVDTLVVPDNLTEREE
jgi:hypothetical protein